MTSGKKVLATTMVLATVIGVVSVINNTRWDSPPVQVSSHEFHRTHKMICKFPLDNKIMPNFLWQTKANCKGDIPKGRSVPMTCKADVPARMMICTEVWKDDK